ncbi:Exo-beta-1,3-glucanase, GH17 family [Methylophilus rhizosphaerae]|uniref:Endo-1,3-beta-glucanase btgC n=1 Tax=Methylophilus rhizosphaerae TaxID=492660 RepID=A0A1G9BGC2_9PROT|nr:glycosyl hydrolase family 17 protein [Methylophilus rhizosphaerae]SDK38562.1 Exo-beta-1,3-glucanase, GH17 family [Methylophilus rhizosphaerae]
MLQRLFFRIPPLFWVSLFLIGSILYVWRLQQPQPLIEVDTEAAKLQCVSYSPYYKPGMSPLVSDTFVDPLQIEQDLQALSKVTSCVRTYALSQGMDYVPKAAHKLGMKVLLGVWIGWVDADNMKQLELAVQQANQYADTVRGIVVGNEVLLRGEQPEARMHEYLQWVKARTKAPVTYADVWEFWLKHPTLEQEVDFVTVHILPYWEDKPVAVEQAVMHTASVMGHLGTVFKKPLLIGETGWPSQGRQRFYASASVVNQARYMREFLHAAKQTGWQYNIIEAFDQPWKRELEGTVGGFWGVFDTDLQPKFSLQGPVAERADGWLPYGIALVLAALAAGWGQYRKLSLCQKSLLAVIAACVGLHAYLQADYVQLAARNTGEYALLAGFVLLGYGLVIAQVRQWLGLAANTCLEQGMLGLFALGLLLTSAGLAVNGRYLDFPLILAWLPLLSILISLLTRAPQQTAQSASEQTTGWLMIVMVLMAANMAVTVAMMETGNVTAWWWAAVCGLALFVLPAKSMQLRQQACE